MRLVALALLLAACGAKTPAAESAKATGKPAPRSVDRCTTGKEPAVNGDEIAGKTIARICIEGGSNETKKKIDDSFALHAGSTFAADALRSDLEAAYATDLFDDIRVNAYGAEGGKVLLVVEIHERPLVGAFDVVGAKANSNSELVKAFPLRVGDRYEPAKLRANVVRLRDGYHAAGFKHAKVETVVEPMNDGRVSVKLQIEEE